MSWSKHLIAVAVVFLGGVWTLLSKGQYCLPIFIEAGNAFWQGINPYLQSPDAPDLFKYSPIWAAFFGAFAFLERSTSLEIAGALFYALNAFSWYWATWSLCRMYQAKNDQIVPLALGLSWPFLLNNGFYGQINGLLLGLCVAGWLLFKDQKHLKSAIFWALAISLKLFPALFVLALPEVRKAPKFLLLLLSFVTIAFILPAAAVGIDVLFEWYQSWLQILQQDRMNPPLKLGLQVIWVKVFFGEPHSRVVLLTNLLLLFAIGTGWKLRRNRNLKVEHLFAALFLWALLSSHMTEPPTLVLLTPIVVSSLFLASPKWIAAFWMIVWVIIPSIGILEIDAYFLKAILLALTFIVYAFLWIRGVRSKESIQVATA